MSASGHSQILLKKTVYNNQKAFIGNEAAMDSIAQTYIKFKASLSYNEQLNIELQLLQKEFEKINLKVNFLSQDNSRLELQKSSLKNQLSVQDQLHEADILYYKEKSKGKLNSFLFGTAAGALIVSIITIIR